jgi:hypothetical protein
VFFDAMGRILVRAGEVLRTDVRGDVDDVYVRQQVDAIALIVGEVGAAWSELFATLEAENAVLERTLASAGGGSSAPDLGADPLLRNATLLSAVDRAIASLHERGDGEALRDVRHGLVEAAELEHGMLSRARERSGMAAVRRL